MTKLRSLPLPVAAKVMSSVSLPPRQADSAYATPAYRRWRSMVVARAGAQCEAIVDGHRCSKRAPHHRMYADHIHELKDGGSLTDPSNGMCLCRQHHLLKTLDARKQRYHPN